MTEEQTRHVRNEMEVLTSGGKKNTIKEQRKDTETGALFSA